MRVMKNFHRPHYHFSPPEMWLNDPNGLVYYAGIYHLFYQHHPKSLVWGPMHWGHAVSRDLINWEHLPIALYPDDHGMIFSGSAVVDWSNTAGFGTEALIAFFTHHTDQGESQSLAYSTNLGYTWTKFLNNPVIQTPTGIKNFRDPKVFWYEDHWVMCLSGGNVILFFISDNLVNWKAAGSFGDEYDSTQGVWETPDLFPLQVKVEGKEEIYWVLTVGVINGAPAGGSGTQYFIGNFDGRTFISNNSKETILWMDHGADFYAAQSWSEVPNRRLMIGWMNNWLYATLVPAKTWRGMFSLIREICITKTSEGIRLVQTPLPETQSLRGNHQHWQDKFIHPALNFLVDIHSQALEIIVEFKLNHESDRLGLRIQADVTKHTTISYSVKHQLLSVDRTKSGEVDFHEDFPHMHSAHLSPVNETIKLHIFTDTSSIEVFANDGLLTFTECIFPDEQNQRLVFFCEGGKVLLKSLDIYQLNPATYQALGNSK